eukprot:gene14764-18040_t
MGKVPRLGKRRGGRRAEKRGRGRLRRCALPSLSKAVLDWGCPQTRPRFPMPRPQSPPADRSPPTVTLSGGRFSGPFSAPDGAKDRQTRPGAGWQQELPLQGVTILAVEDSRFACEALRLIARRAGARLRRAETMAAARDHLRVYRPDVVLIDLGLPDGRGDALI